jgi:sporulation integral membrane protein YtvI
MVRKNFPYLVLCGALAVFIFYLGFKYVLPVALPFLIAFFIAASVQGAAARFSARTGIKKRTVSLLFGLLFFVFVGFLVFLFVSKLWGELAAIARGALDAREDIMGLTGALLRRAESLILRFFPAAEGGAEILRARIELFAEEALRSIVSAVSTRLPAFMGKVFASVPKILFSLGTALISCVYLCLDYDYISTRARHMLSHASPLLAKVPHTSFITIAKYLRALFVMFLLSAAVLAAGFLLLGVKYAWLFALAAAFIDALPVFGSGALLFPFAAYLFISGDFIRGAGTVALWGAVTLMRQILEPKIMGRSLGVHPLINLAAVYAGASLFGASGIIFLPITVVILKNLFLPEERSSL